MIFSIASKYYTPCEPLSRIPFEISEKLPHAFLVTQNSKEDYTGFPDFSMHFVSV
jgi:hypothetical protein